MILQEKINIIEATIRKELPRLTEVKEGCYLKRNGNIYKIVNEGYNSAVLSQDSQHIYFAISPNYFKKPEFLEISEKEIKEYEIIGYDIILTDVFEWLGTFFPFSIDHEGIIYKEFDYYFEAGLYRDYTEFAKVDFSKPYLKDQSEKLINFLYNLLKLIDE